MPSEQWVQTVCSPFPLAVTSCAVQFYLHCPLISHRTVRRLPIGKDSQELCVPSRLDVYRRQSNFFFLSTKTKMLGDCQIPLLKMHTFMQACRRRCMDEYICIALSGEPLALKIKHFGANWLFKLPKYRIAWYGWLFRSAVVYQNLLQGLSVYMYVYAHTQQKTLLDQLVFVKALQETSTSVYIFFKLMNKV